MQELEAFSEGILVIGFKDSLLILDSARPSKQNSFQGLRLAKSHGISKLIVHTDSQVVFNKLQIPSPRHRAYYHLVKQSQDLLNCPDWDVVFEHCYRESNRAADFLANMGIAQTSAFVLFDSPPAPLGKTLYEENSVVALSLIHI